MTDKNTPSAREQKQAVSCFQLLYPEELDFLNEKKKQVLYQKGETIVKQGAFAPFVLYVIKGLAKVYLQSGSSKQINIRICKEGDFMAFSSIFGQNVYRYSALALKETSVCMIEKEALKQLLLKNTDFALRITSRNYNNESRFLEIIEDISFKQMRGKLASALLYLSSEEFVKEKIFHYLTRQDIAEFASITTESAIKFIKEFEKDGIIKLHGKDIEILDVTMLSEISRRG